MSMHRWIDKEDVVHVYSGLLLNHKKEWNNAIFSNMDGPRDYHTKWSKSEREGQIPSAFFFNFLAAPTTYGNSQGQGSYLTHSCDLHHSCSNEGFLTHCATAGTPCLYFKVFQSPGYMGTLRAKLIDEGHTWPISVQPSSPKVALSPEMDTGWDNKEHKPPQDPVQQYPQRKRDLHRRSE